MALVLAAPYYLLVGFWFARRRSDEAGVAIGAVTAVLSFLILDLAAVAYSAETQPWPKPLVWLGLGISMTIVTATLGALCGLLGAAISHSPLIRQFLHDP